MSKPAPVTYTVVLRTDPAYHLPAIQRLRKFLKVARRSYGLICTGLAQSNDPDVAVGSVPPNFPQAGQCGK